MFSSSMLWITKIVILFNILNFSKADRLSPIETRLRRRDVGYVAQIIQSDWKMFNEFLTPVSIKRVSDTPEIQTVEKFIVSTLENFGWTIEYDKFQDSTPYGIKTFNNIIATFNIGKNFENTENINKDHNHLKNRVIFACHYDSKYFEKGVFIGAIDSAVPCAMLLEMAKFLNDNFDKNRFNYLSRHLQFIFFDGEEAFKDWTETDSIYGSRHFANLLNQKYTQNAFDSIDLFVLLDLLGGDQSQFLNFFPQTSHVYNMLAKIEKTLQSKNLLNQKTPYYFLDTNGYNGIYSRIEDDHKPFLNYDVPILHLIPVPFPKQWHKLTDTVENLNKNRINDLRLIIKYFLSEILHVSIY